MKSKVSVPTLVVVCTLFVVGNFQQLVLKNPLVELRCGEQQADDRYRPENDTATIDEFPWLALLRYQHVGNKSDAGFKCLGSLITRRYVLTKAFCLDSDKFKLMTVRLGEYDPRTDIDCVVSDSQEECNSPTEDVSIDAKIPHHSYKLPSKDYDIALLRLSKDVPTSDYVRTICLPPSSPDPIEDSTRMFISGWASPSNNILAPTSMEVRKKKGIVEILSKDSCDTILKFYNRGVARDGNETVMPYSRTEDLFCVRQIGNEGPCLGDGGGPLMNEKKYKWRQDGISLSVFYANKTYGCFPGTISLHLKVANFVDWILQNIINQKEP